MRGRANRRAGGFDMGGIVAIPTIRAYAPIRRRRPGVSVRDAAVGGFPSDIDVAVAEGP